MGGHAWIAPELREAAAEASPRLPAVLHGDGISVVTGDLDNRETYEAVACGAAKLVVANRNDAENSNIALIVRERFPEVTIAAFAEGHDTVELRLSRKGPRVTGRISLGTDILRFLGKKLAEFSKENFE